MKLLIAALVATFLYWTPTVAPASEIREAKDCGEWLRERQSKEKHAEQSWMLGYLSGLAVGTKRDFLRGTSSEALKLWVDNYCKVNPLNNLGVAGAELAKELIKQKNPKRNQPEAKQQPL
jgi:hypothetical protein